MGLDTCQHWSSSLPFQAVVQTDIRHNLYVLQKYCADQHAFGLEAPLAVCGCYAMLCYAVYLVFMSTLVGIDTSPFIRLASCPIHHGALSLPHSIYPASILSSPPKQHLDHPTRGRCHLIFIPVPTPIRTPTLIPNPRLSTHDSNLEHLPMNP
jgi:hypothetical protein